MSRSGIGNHNHWRLKMARISEATLKNREYMRNYMRDYSQGIKRRSFSYRLSKVVGKIGKIFG